MCVEKIFYTVFTVITMLYSGYVQAYDFFQPESDDSALLNTDHYVRSIRFKLGTKAVGN
jgi:Ni,Fe-hydrogenase I cytochrome b subunit